MSTKSPFNEVVDIIKENGGTGLTECIQCGTCSGICPWRDYLSFLPRKLINEARIGITDFESNAIWRCVTCGQCLDKCPRQIPITAIMRALRQAVTGLGIAEVPTSLQATLKNLQSTANPMGEPPEKRFDSITDTELPELSGDSEYLFFPCCYSTFDPAQRGIFLSQVQTLTKAQVRFGVLFNQSCCGESARKCGDEELFQTLAESNSTLFRNAGVSKIITNSPHCQHTFLHEYPSLGSIEVIHISRLLADLREAGKLRITTSRYTKVTYHDPCYLGRHNREYQSPRNLILSIPGVELLEMPQHAEESLCCGGGGGRIWMDTPSEERFCITRLRQAVATGAEVLITACPYCQSNFQDASVIQSLPDGFRIIDIADFIAESM